MKTVTIGTTELTLNWTNAITAGHGHKRIDVELEVNGQYKTFNAITSNMPSYDEANELDGNEKDFALYGIIAGQIEDQVSEWLEEVL